MRASIWARVAAVAVACVAARAQAQCTFPTSTTFHVSTPAGGPTFYYAFQECSGMNPTLTLTRGQTYTFDYSGAPIHPSMIASDTSNPPTCAPGASPCSSSDMQSFTFTPTTAGTDYFICTIHFFYSQLVVVDAPDAGGCSGPCITGGPCGATGCDATGACIYPTGVCSPASCANGVASSQTSCSGGTCPAPTTSDCSPYVCGASACLTSCGTASDCVTGDTCSGGACVTDAGTPDSGAPDAGAADAGPLPDAGAVSDAGTGVDAGNDSGVVTSDSGTSEDSGTAPDAGAADAGSSGGSSTGCGCSQTGIGWTVAGLLVAAGLATRRRRRRAV